MQCIFSLSYKYFTTSNCNTCCNHIILCLNMSPITCSNIRNCLSLSQWQLQLFIFVFFRVNSLINQISLNYFSVRYQRFLSLKPPSPLFLLTSGKLPGSRLVKLPGEAIFTMVFMVAAYSCGVLYLIFIYLFIIIFFLGGGNFRDYKHIIHICIEL